MKNIVKLAIVFLALSLTALIGMADATKYYNYELIVVKGEASQLNEIRYAHNLVEAENTRNELTEGATPIAGAAVSVDYYLDTSNRFPLFTLNTGVYGTVSFSEQDTRSRYHVKVSMPGYMIKEFDMMNQDPEANSRNTMFVKIKLGEFPKSINPEIIKRRITLPKRR